MELIGVYYDTLSKNEAKSLANCFNAYAENCLGEEISEMGFNTYEDYAYIALEDLGISIRSQNGEGVKYLVTNFSNNEETFLDTYQEAIDFSDSINF